MAHSRTHVDFTTLRSSLPILNLKCFNYSNKRDKNERSKHNIEFIEARKDASKALYSKNSIEME